MSDIEVVYQPTPRTGRFQVQKYTEYGTWETIQGNYPLDDLNSTWVQSEYVFRSDAASKADELALSGHVVRVIRKPEVTE